MIEVNRNSIEFNRDLLEVNIQSSAETYIRFIMNSIGGKTLSPDIIGTATISGAKLFLMKDLKLIYIFQDKLIIKFYFKVTKRNANLPFLSVNFPSVCSEITSQIVCKFLQIIVVTKVPIVPIIPTVPIFLLPSKFF